MGDHTARASMITVAKQFNKGKRIISRDESREDIDILVFETEDIASTSVKLGLTINLDHYESCRMDVMVTVPHYEEERDEAFLYALDQAEQKLQLVTGDKQGATDMVDRARNAMKDG